LKNQKDKDFDDLDLYESILKSDDIDPYESFIRISFKDEKLEENIV
tara:strand:+ start:219 stop:356 length:138 start_codon:yes stop_codon:yes gene_type:complete